MLATNSLDADCLASAQMINSRKGGLAGCVTARHTFRQKGSTDRMALVQPRSPIPSYRVAAPFCYQALINVQQSRVNSLSYSSELRQWRLCGLKPSD